MWSLPPTRPLVLHVRTVSGFGGGPEKTILNSPRFLRQLGYDCLCAYLHPPHDAGFDRLAERAQAAQARIESLMDSGPLDWRTVQRLVRLCRAENVAIWHGHDYKTNVLGLLVRPFHPMKLATTVHGWVHHFGRSAAYYRLDKFTLRYYDEVICVSPDLREECLRYGVPRDRCHLIYNAIDTEEYCRANLGWPPQETPSARSGPFVVGALGRLEQEKCFDVLIAAVDRLVRAGRDIELVIGGEGSQREELRNQISSCVDPSRIRLLGHVETKSFFRDLNAFVLSSSREGLPNVILEAMALEVPLIATPVGGVPGLVEDHVNGRIVPVQDIAALAAGLTQIMDRPEEAHTLARGARQTIVTRFSFRRRMEKMASLYDRMLHGSRSGQPLPQGAIVP